MDPIRHGAYLCLGAAHRGRRIAAEIRALTERLEVCAALRDEAKNPGCHRAARDATGATCQIVRAYSRIARSDENRPARAVLRIDERTHLPGVRHRSSTLRWQSA